MRETGIGDRVFNLFNKSFMVIFCVIILYPYISVLAVALNDNNSTAFTGVMLFPQIPTLVNFKILLADNHILNAAVISVLRIVFGVALTLTVEFAASYVLIKKQFKARKIFTMFFLIPMYIQGGLIPTYLIFSKVHLSNNFLVYVLPYAFSFFDVLIMRTYMYTIPESLEESARLDGANEFTILRKIFLPLSAPIIATVALYQGVFHWNDWTTTLYFVTKSNLNPLQFELQRVLREQDRVRALVQAAIMSGDAPKQTVMTSVGLRDAQIIISTLPIILIYPFLQKYFIKGLLIGGVKE